MSGRQLVFSPRSRKDLADIWQYTVGQWDADQADEYVRLIVTACERLAGGLIDGRLADDVRTGYRSWPAGSHLVFFTLTGRSMTVMRVLHQRMDPRRHL